MLPLLPVVDPLYGIGNSCKINWNDILVLSHLKCQFVRIWFKILCIPTQSIPNGPGGIYWWRTAVLFSKKITYNSSKKKGYFLRWPHSRFWNYQLEIYDFWRGIQCENRYKTVRIDDFKITRLYGFQNIRIFCIWTLGDSIRMYNSYKK